MTDIPNYRTWQPEPIDPSFTIDFKPMRSEASDSWCECIVSRFQQPTNRLEPDKAAALVPILTVSAWGLSPQMAQYEAFKQAAYYLHYGLLPHPNDLELSGNLYSPPLDPDYTSDGRMVVPVFDDETAPAPRGDRVRVVLKEDLEESP